ncbi:MAG: proline--tRNA ligase [Pseudomonadota bacterium]|nr:proline--tRNA ligase [Pseudomonadota bacterium]
MRLSQFFLPLLKENPSEAQIVSHRLMLRAGMIRQQAAGIYSWLPLGLRVLENIENIVADELNKAGCNRVLMPTLQPAELWKESGRYDSMGQEMLRFPDRAERELIYSPTNEEMIVDIFRSYVKSYKQLPINLYQIQWKFRDEVRPRFGIMRGREFLMKDAYSFHIDVEDARREYAKMYDAYHRIFARMELMTVAVNADSGAIGGSLSHEFQVIADTGESALYYDAAFDEVRSGKVQMSGEEMRGLYAAADELHIPDKCPVPKDRLREARGIEVGHVFFLGSKYSKAMGVTVAAADGAAVTPEMGCYGIGVSRLVGAIIEASHDENGVIWPESVAPFRVGIINLRVGDARCDALCEQLYDTLGGYMDTLYDDTDARAGEKFARMDLIGLPWQVVVGPKGAEKGAVEVKYRKSGEKVEMNTESVLPHLLRGIDPLAQDSATGAG